MPINPSTLHPSSNPKIDSFVVCHTTYSPSGLRELRCPLKQTPRSERRALRAALAQSKVELSAAVRTHQLAC
jgi:hypothetical protein